MENINSIIYNAAIYLRLSREDGDVAEGSKLVSNSISNQKALVMDFLKSHTEIKVHSVYADDGGSSSEILQETNDTTMHENTTSESQVGIQNDNNKSDEYTKITATIENTDDVSEDAGMKLYINDTEIPVSWEDNDTTKELVEQAKSGDIIVSMSMYSDNEQVGSLGRSYTRNDKQTTTHNGDIVLYNGNNIVVFYGSNSWSYTRLGKMDMSESEILELLSNGDVELKISIE